MYKVYNNNVVIRYNKPIVLLLHINNNDVHVLYINISSVFIYNNILILVIHISKYTLLVIGKLLSKIGNVLHVFFFLIIFSVLQIQSLYRLYWILML